MSKEYFPFLQTASGKWIVLWFLDLLGLLYHTTVHRKDMLIIGTILSVPTQD